MKGYNAMGFYSTWTLCLRWVLPNSPIYYVHVLGSEICCNKSSQVYSTFEVWFIVHTESKKWSVVISVR